MPDDTQRRLSLRVVAMPKETNQYGTIFGGVILSSIDQAAFVEARRHGSFSWVTASVNTVNFEAPVYVGDIVSLYTRTTRLGRTSVGVSVEVEAERWTDRALVRVTEAALTMVAIGPDGRPTPFREVSASGKPEA
jgi:acyl-CoA thioesterase YciA